jgi:flavin reductase (DIM6/NTAB) family NADH-FMN oxidoreductase RutF
VNIKDKVAEPRSSVPFYKDWWPAPVTLISCGLNEPGAKRGANIWVVGVLGGPCDDPPLLTISPRVGMYSYKLMKEIGEFVVNFPAAHMVREMEYCGTHTGIEVDKWKACGFTAVPGQVVRVPLIAECPVNLECTIEDELRFTGTDGVEAEHVMLIGRIVQVNAHDKYLINGRLQWDMVDTIYRARPRTWRSLGPVLGYDCRKDPLLKPVEAAELVNERVASLAGLASLIRQTPYPTQVTES